MKKLIINPNVCKKEVFKVNKKLTSINDLVGSNVIIVGVSFEHNFMTKEGEKTRTIIYTNDANGALVGYYSVAGSFARALEEIADIFEDEIISESGLEIVIEKGKTAERRDYFDVTLP